MKKVRKSWCCIFSRERPFHKQAVSDLGPKRSIHRPLKVAHSSFIEGSHATKNTASSHFQNKPPPKQLTITSSTSDLYAQIGKLRLTNRARALPILVRLKANTVDQVLRGLSRHNGELTKWHSTILLLLAATNNEPVHWWNTETKNISKNAKIKSFQLDSSLFTRIKLWMILKDTCLADNLLQT